MQVGYFAQGEGPHLDMAKHLIASCKQHMPGVEIFQLTDAKTPCLEGATAIRLEGKMPMGVRRVRHYAVLKGDWLLLDTDVLVRGDVRDVFKQVFDVALVSRDGTYMEGTDYAIHNPYNFGVVFSRCPRYWQFILPHLLKMPEKYQEWGGEQLLTCELANQALSEFSVRILDSAYNFTPEKREDDVSHAKLLHLKGPRKAWLSHFTT